MSLTMKNERRRRFIAFFERRYKGDRGQFIQDTGLTKGRVSQLFDPQQPFGEVAARRLAEQLDLPPNYFESDRPEDAPSPASQLPEEAIPFRPRLRRVWVCGTCQGGIPDRVWEGSWQEMAQEYAEVASADPQAFLCEVVGSSMAPRYMPREFALIEPGTAPELEDDVLVCLKSGETMLKRLLGRRSGIRLGSYNDSEIITFTEEELEWMYYCAHPVPRRKIKRREDFL